MRAKLLCLTLLLSACSDNKVEPNMPEMPADATGFQFFGDSREGNEVFLDLMRLAYSHYPPGAVIHLGDIISSPRKSHEWPIIQALISRYFSPDRLYMTVGNHDVDNALSLSLMASVFPIITEKGYYYRKISGCFCIFLNSEDLSTNAVGLGAEQRQWLEDILASDEAQSSAYRFVMLHRPFYPQNQYAEEGFEGADELHQLFLKRNVTAVISGHEHSYTHIQKDTIHYLITGGAGSPLVHDGGKAGYYHYVQMFERPDSLEFYAIDYRGIVRNEFKIELPSTARASLH